MNGDARTLYCYVDESGQDNRSKLFFVVAVICSGNQGGIRDAIEDIEQKSGVGKKKWHKSEHVRRMRFLHIFHSQSKAAIKVYFGVYKKPIPYFFPMLEVVSQAVDREYEFAKKLRVYVDGIDKKKARELTNALRTRSFSLGLVRTCRDESEPMIRLADRYVGCIRGLYEGNQDQESIVKRAMKQGYLIQLTS